MKEQTKYEKTRIIGSRALQISMGAPFLVKLKESDLEKIKYNPVEIAKMEYDLDLIPIAVKTPMPRSKNFEAENAGNNNPEAS